MGWFKRETFKKPFKVASDFLRGKVSDWLDKRDAKRRDREADAAFKRAEQRERAWTSEARRALDETQRRARLIEEPENTPVAEAERVIRALEEAEKKRRAAFPDVDEDDGLSPRPPLPSTLGDERAVVEWISSGEFKIVDGSSNVYAIMYDAQLRALYVQYKHWDPSMPLGTQSGPGPIYEYRNVSPKEARDAFFAASLGTWIWDVLRVRGTWSGHKKEYRLVAPSNGYVPRQAVANYKGDGREWFVRRRLWNADGSSMESSLPDRPAPSMRGTAPDRGRPNRGRPNRGRPNRGRPDDGELS